MQHQRGEYFIYRHSEQDIDSSKCLLASHDPNKYFPIELFEEIVDLIIAPVKVNICFLGEPRFFFINTMYLLILIL